MPHEKKQAIQSVSASEPSEVCKDDCRPATKGNVDDSNYPRKRGWAKKSTALLIESVCVEKTKQTDAGITKDSSQEIEGLLEKERWMRVGACPSYVCHFTQRPHGRSRLHRSLQLEEPIGRSSEDDDMHASQQA